MKVLHVVNGLPKKKNIKNPVHGIFTKTQIDSLKDLDIENDVLEVGSISIKNLVKEISDIRKEIKNEKPNIIHAHYGIQGFLSIFQRSTPVTISYMGSDINIMRNKNGRINYKSVLTTIMSQLSSLFSTNNITKSEQLKEQLWFKPAQKKSIVIPNGVDMKLFKKYDMESSRKKIGFDLSSKIVLFVSNPKKIVKRFDLASEAVNIAKKSVRELELKVVYNKPQELMPYYYSASNCLLLTSDFEGSPNVVKEALACGLPVVSVNVGDVEERLENIENCYLCKRDPFDLANGIIKSIESGKRIDYEDALKSLDLKIIAKRIENVYENSMIKFEK